MKNNLLFVSIQQIKPIVPAATLTLPIPNPLSYNTPTLSLINEGEGIEH